MDLSLPLKDPIVIFLIILSITLFSPLILGKLRIPGIIGMLLAGVILGPHGLNVLAHDASITLFGKVGLLYIMFLAGLEVDMNDFMRARVRSTVFGLLSFILPIGAGFVAVHYGLGLDVVAALLLGAMLASHTLVSYPIASKLGIARSETVTISIGATIIADTLVLLVLAVIINTTQGDASAMFWIKLSLSILGFMAVMIWLVPIIGRWVFRNLAEERSAQFLFVLVVVFAAAFLAELAGMEGIIGAFFAGLALNRLIPHTSPLMNRVEFVGNNLFVPFFLISVGMIVNFRAVVSGSETLILASTLIAVGLATKWIAAFVTQKLFKFSKVERQLMFGLTTARVGASLALVLVGYEIGLLNETALNATILVILVTILVSSFATASAGRKLALTDAQSTPELHNTSHKVLIPVSNPDTVIPLLDLAGFARPADSKEPIYALSVVLDNDEARQNVLLNKRLLEKAEKYAAAMDNKVEIVSRVDLSIASGIKRAIKELNINFVVMGWSPKLSTRDRLFGSVLDNMLFGNGQLILVCHFVVPLNTIGRIVVSLPINAQWEPGFEAWLNTLKNLVKQTGAKVVVNGDESALREFQTMNKKKKPYIEATYHETNDYFEVLMKPEEIGESDLLFLLQSRPGFISYTGNMELVPRKMVKNFQEKNFVIVYPEQQQASTVSEWEASYT